MPPYGRDPRRGFEIFDPSMLFPDWPGAHPGVQCQFWPMVIYWMLGYPDRSLDELRAAVRSAETLGHPLTLAHTLSYGAFVHIWRHEPSAVADYAGRALRISEEQRIAQFRGTALCLNGWALGVSGESEKGLVQIGQGLDGYQGGSQHLQLALQADAQLASGRPEAALASVAAGLTTAVPLGQVRSVVGRRVHRHTAEAPRRGPLAQLQSPCTARWQQGARSGLPVSRP